jgi:hypothetical protein
MFSLSLRRRSSPTESAQRTQRSCPIVVSFLFCFIIVCYIAYSESRNILNLATSLSCMVRQLIASIAEFANVVLANSRAIHGSSPIRKSCCRPLLRRSFRSPDRCLLNRFESGPGSSWLTVSSSIFAQDLQNSVFKQRARRAIFVTFRKQHFFSKILKYQRESGFQIRLHRVGETIG